MIGGLRAVRPEVDLLWWGLYGFTAIDKNEKSTTVYQPCWMLVVPGAEQTLRENAARALDAWAKAEVQRQHPQKVKLALLRYRGWQPIMSVPARDPDWGVVDDFAAYDWADRFGACARSGTELVEDEQLEKRTAQMRDAVQASMKDVWRYVWKGRRSVLQLKTAA